MHRWGGGGGLRCLKLDTCMVGIRGGGRGSYGGGGGVRGSSAVSRLTGTDAREELGGGGGKMCRT